MSTNVSSLNPAAKSIVDPMLLELQGILFVALVGISLPLNFRILYIFACNPSYRNLQCYRIMIHIGVAQCLFAPGVFFQGIMKLLEYDLYGLASLTVKAHPPVSRAEALLELALALNRLKIICKLRYPSVVHTILVIIAWSLGLLFFISYFVCDPYFSVTATPDKILPFYDLTKPWSMFVRQAAAAAIVITSSHTLVVYAIILVYILNAKRSAGHIFKSYREKHILLYAGTRFLFDLVNALSLLYRPFADNVIVEFLLSFGYPFNYLCLPPLLYLSMHKEVRRQFVPKLIMMDANVNPRM
uniref:G protein-coupled receptor n=1 Tax=Steinernema glaseri TaxID=37863 RepID=A0A1I8AU89_9BILA